MLSRDRNRPDRALAATDQIPELVRRACTAHRTCIPTTAMSRVSASSRSSPGADTEADGIPIGSMPAFKAAIAFAIWPTDRCSKSSVAGSKGNFLQRDRDLHDLKRIAAERFESSFFFTVSTGRRKRAANAA